MEVNGSTQFNEWTFKKVVAATLILAGVVLCFWLLFRFYEVVFILLVSIVIGTALRPIVNWLFRLGLPREVGVILIYLLLLALVIGFLLVLFPLIYKQTITIVAEVPVYYQNLSEWMRNSTSQIIVSLSDFLPPSLPFMAPVEQTGQQFLASAEQAMGYLNTISKTIFLIIVILVLALHWLVDGSRTIQSWLSLVPKNRQESINTMISSMETKIGYFIAGQSILCLIIGILAFFAYQIIGLPNAFVLALMAGVLEAVPMIGPMLGAIPAGIIALSISPIKLLWVVVGTIVIQALENYLLVPRIMRKAVGINPFVSLLAIFAFSSFFGIAGALMAIPIAAIIQLLLDHFIFHPTAAEPEDSAGRDQASRLRYEAQDLAKGLRNQARNKKAGSTLLVKQIDKVMDEVETIASDLDSLLAQIQPSSKL